MEHLCRERIKTLYKSNGPSDLVLIRVTSKAQFLYPSQSKPHKPFLGNNTSNPIEGKKMY